jgi:hypothetical protein
MRDPGIAGAARVVTFRERFGLALQAFCESLLESRSKPRRDRAPAWRDIKVALRDARAKWRSHA